MALLQFDMLAHESEAGDKVTVVIGLGIPESWLESPMSVKGLSLRNGRLDWQWDGKDMEISWCGTENIDFLLGPGFPAETRIVDHYRNGCAGA
jgi:hypothetical protein